MSRGLTETPLRVPLKQWVEDMDKIQAEWNGKEPGNGESRYDLAGEAIILIEKLDRILNELEY